jgi:hypothetical protein
LTSTQAFVGQAKTVHAHCGGLLSPSLQDLLSADDHQLQRASCSLLQHPTIKSDNHSCGGLALVDAGCPLQGALGGHIAVVDAAPNALQMVAAAGDGMPLAVAPPRLQLPPKATWSPQQLVDVAVSRCEPIASSLQLVAGKQGEVEELPSHRRGS